MKISAITATYNSEKTIAETLQSVADQSYPQVEHIIVDGASRDNTLEMVKQFPHLTKIISEPDKGMYDALNKGIKLATGDVIGILNSDDRFHDPEVLSKIARVFEDPKLDAVYGDIRFVSSNDPDKTIRYYSSAHFRPEKFAWGYMPAHPSFYARKEVYEKYGLFQEDYKIAADYELLTRFLYKHRIKAKYLPLLMVDMLPGGLSNSSIYSRYLLNKEIIRACAGNGIKTNMLKLSLKYFKKIFEYV